MIFILTGGTGGHIVPARCLAIELARQGHKVTVFGDIKYRNYISSNDDFKSVIIPSTQASSSLIGLAKMLIKISCGSLLSLLHILLKRPSYIIGFGGYATFPTLIAATLTKRKIILHEQNAHLGKVNRLFAKYAYKIATTFPQTDGIDKSLQHKVTWVGNPIRDEISRLNFTDYTLPKFAEESSAELPDNRLGYKVLLASDFENQSTEIQQEYFNILIVGGSGGAKIFSDVIPKALFNLSNDFKGKIYVSQQCRAELVESTAKQYQAFDMNSHVSAFFYDMPKKIANAHLIIARSGSSSMFEFCAAKKPMILIPFAKSADDHQLKNARYCEQNHAAIVIEEKDFTINKIYDLLKELMTDAEKLETMSQAAGNLARLDATKKLAQLIY